MNVWLAIALILGVITVYQALLQVFMISLKLTGMATNKVKFQVASLFTGAGFTTQESELIVNNDKRRKIATACMYSGHAFSVAFMGLFINVLFSISMSVSNTAPEKRDFGSWYFIILYISVGFFLIMLIIKIPPIHRRFIRMLESVAINSMKHNRKTNIITVFDMYGKHAIAEVYLNFIPEFAKDTPLFKMGLTKDYSINILSIKRGQRIIEVSKNTMFAEGDILVIYGLIQDIQTAFVNSVDKKQDVVIINKTNDVTLIDNYGTNALAEIHVENVPPELENVKIQDAHLKDRYGITIGIIKRNDEYIPVDKDTIIEKNDTLIFVNLV